MTDQQREKILEAACEICRRPGEVKDPDILRRQFCDRCPVEAAIDPPPPPGTVICSFCKKPVSTKPENGLRYCPYCLWWINEDGSPMKGPATKIWQEARQNECRK